MRNAMCAAVLVLGAALAGCMDSDGQGTPAAQGRLDPASGLWLQQVAGVHWAWAPGARSTATAGAAAVDIDLPSSTLRLDGAADGPVRASLWAPMRLEAGQSVQFLPAPGNATLDARIDGRTVPLGSMGSGLGGSWNQVVSGELAWELMDIQRRDFPHRTPGEPNYGAAIDYFAQFFTDLGYEVEVDPYGTQQLPQTVCVPVPVSGERACPEGLANVVATKRGTTRPDEVTLIGGHMDVVPATVEGAMDNTIGTVAVMSLASALAPFELERTVSFALWGGEESGLLGSMFWVQTHPEARAQVNPYWNMDVVGLSWPAPLVTGPDAHAFSAGPDDAGSGGMLLGTAMLDWLRAIQTQWLQFPTQVHTPDGEVEVFRYQVTASGVNTPPPGSLAVGFSASDHASFQSAGIPSYAAHHAGDYPPGIHNPADTLDNLTKYAYYGTDMDADSPWTDEGELALGKDAVARSLETVMWFPFYDIVLTDLGVHDPPTPGMT